jgi:hypothetical protein
MGEWPGLNATKIRILSGGLKRLRKKPEYEAKSPKNMPLRLKPTFIPGRLRHG